MHAGTTCKILFLAASPRHEDRLALHHELRQIEQVVRMGPYREKFALVSCHAVRPADLQHALLLHRPDVVHISSHGRERTGLSLEDDDGDAQPMRADVLARLFAALPMRIQLVVLNACDSMATAQAIHPHVGAVIGMDGVLGDDSAIHFSTAFYRALVHGETVMSALELGQVEIGLHGLLEHSVPSILAGPGVDPSTMRFAPESLAEPGASLSLPGTGKPTREFARWPLVAMLSLLQIGCCFAAFWFTPGFRETILLQAILISVISAVTWNQLRSCRHYRFTVYVLVMAFLTYAPVALNAEKYYSIIVAQSRDLHEFFPKTSIAIYAFVRGIGNMAWTIPLLLYLFWYIMEDTRENMAHLWKKCLYLGVILQTMAVGMVLYYDAILSRTMTSAEGAGSFASQIEESQTNYLLACVTYLSCGYATLFAVRRERRESGFMMLVITGALIVQIGYWFSQQHVARLNMQYPALRNLDDAGQAYRSEDGRVVYTSSFFNDIGSAHLRHWQPFSVCLNPQSGQFDFTILPKRVFLDKFRPVNPDLLPVKDYFCVPSEAR